MARAEHRTHLVSRRGRRSRAAAALGLAALWLTGAASAVATESARHDFELYDLDDQLVATSVLRQEPGARALVVDFFQVDCLPCKEGLAEWAEVYRGRQAAGLRLVVVAVPGAEAPAEALTRVTAYFHAHEVPFPVVFDKYGVVAKRFGVATADRVEVPRAFLLDRSGALVADGRSPADLKAPLRKQLAK